MGIKKGTILTDNPKGNTLKFRLDDETMDQLRIIAEKNNVSKSEVIREGIRIQYRNLNK